MAVVRVPGSSARVAEVLGGLFRGHGVEAVRDADVLRFPGRPGLWADGELFNPQERAGQLDVRLGLADGRVVVESVAGIGTTPEAQTDDGLRAFASTTFHVLLSAFFDQPPCHGTERVGWTVGGRPRAVFVGGVTTRFGFPPAPDGTQDVGFFAHFERALKPVPLPAGAHWVRVYQMRHQARGVANEVLIDNDARPELQAAMAAYDWPRADGWYDVRVFLVIRDA